MNRAIIINAQKAGAMKFEKGEKVLWHGEPAIIWDIITKSPKGNPVKWYAIKRNTNSISSHLVAEEANTLHKIVGA